MMRAFPGNTGRPLSGTLREKINKFVRSWYSRCLSAWKTAISRNAQRDTLSSHATIRILLYAAEYYDRKAICYGIHATFPFLKQILKYQEHEFFEITQIFNQCLSD